MNRSIKNIINFSSLATSDLLAFSIPLIFLSLIDTSIIRNIVITLETYSFYSIQICFAAIFIFWNILISKHYRYRKNFWYEINQVLKAIVALAILQLIFFTMTNYKDFFLIWLINWICIAILIPFTRIIARKVLVFINCWQWDTVIIGTGKNAVETLKAIKNERSVGLNVIALISPEVGTNDKQICEKIVHQLNPDSIIQTFTHDQQFIIALEPHQSSLTNQLLRNFLINNYHHVSIVPPTRGIPLINTNIGFLFGQEIMIFHIQQHLSKISSKILKRIFDITVSLAILLTLSPLMIIVFLKIKADGGPALYGHERVGKNGKLFKCLKFRSMAINSQELLEQILAIDPEARQEWNETFKLKNDPRVTKVGAFLRKTSLDELPQLFNILKGEMSLVGPRPVTAPELERYKEDIAFYLMAKPGLTGLWQVSGRSDVDYDTRIYFDTWYIKNWSLWNDFVIVLKTVKAVLARDGAY
ncbi:MAG: undecaprenyl-phosphate galactose phosphotransferase WbaP [Acinetobacter populi]|jgi:undecaprenyl-phosphate galactose phosphotransferase|uniref:undecaprenyl-phosphate galactose phosphotransferase WbaP n=1 Tax=Acinetobacter populi TaxID=1582270 RepID=UPI00235657E2|nr:undecaprenyl-phosphate galactose phosphotransferase WbaP [Acinetobacter populi]MCH4248686.1 undecaprenyl-phosphate galactose phosphotransferase WbaP [Acinetobacter populi]